MASYQDPEILRRADAHNHRDPIDITNAQAPHGQSKRAEREGERVRRRSTGGCYRKRPLAPAPPPSPAAVPRGAGVDIQCRPCAAWRRSRRGARRQRSRGAVFRPSHILGRRPPRVSTTVTAPAHHTGPCPSTAGARPLPPSPFFALFCNTVILEQAHPTRTCAITRGGVWMAGPRSSCSGSSSCRRAASRASRFAPPWSAPATACGRSAAWP